MKKEESDRDFCYVHWRHQEKNYLQYSMQTKCHKHLLNWWNDSESRRY